MAKQVLEKNKIVYLDNPYQCPFCGSTDILFRDITNGLGKLFQSACCDICENEWREVYNLTDVEGV